MRRRHPAPPRFWLMTDERLGDSLWGAVERLPRGGGIVFRHYQMPPKARLALFARLRLAAHRRGLVLLLAGATPALAIRWRADGVHNPPRTPLRFPGALMRTRAVHGAADLHRAAGADLVFLSPAFPTASHPAARPLGPLRFRLLARQATMPVIALGGVTRHRARRLHGAVHGWAGIDAWAAKDQKRKAVPI